MAFGKRSTSMLLLLRARVAQRNGVAVTLNIACTLVRACWSRLAKVSPPAKKLKADRTSVSTQLWSDSLKTFVLSSPFFLTACQLSTREWSDPQNTACSVRSLTWTGHGLGESGWLPRSKTTYAPRTKESKIKFRVLPRV